MDDVAPILSAAVFFVGLFAFMIYFYVIRILDHVRASIVLIPALAVVIGVACAASAVPAPLILMIELLFACAEGLYLYGPFRVVGWAWPSGERRKLPPLTSGILVGVAAAVAIPVAVLSFGLTSSDPSEGPFGGPGSDVIVVVMQSLLIWAVSYAVIRGFYAMVLGCVTVSEEEKTGVLKQCWVDGHCHIVSFDSDTNGYHVSPATYADLTSRRKGTAYSYTLVTGLGGQQFIHAIRKPAPLSFVVADRPSSAVDTWADPEPPFEDEESAPATNPGQNGIPQPRLLGGTILGAALNTLNDASPMNPPYR